MTFKIGQEAFRADDFGTEYIPNVPQDDITWVLMDKQG